MMQTKKYLILANLLKKTDYNATICEIKNKIPSISSLATNSALTAVENKKPDVRNIIKKKHIMMRKYPILKRKLMVMIVGNVLLLQNSTS